jgi:hypothetical protein
MSWLSLLLFTGMLVATSYLLPAELGRRADPNRTPLPILSDWYFLALYQYVKYTPPLWAGLGPGLLIGFGMLVPFLDRSKGRRPLDRPFFLVVGCAWCTSWSSTLIMFNIAVIEREPLVRSRRSRLTAALVWKYAGGAIGQAAPATGAVPRRPASAHQKSCA